MAEWARGLRHTYPAEKVAHRTGLRHSEAAAPCSAEPNPARLQPIDLLPSLQRQLVQKIVLGFYLYLAHGTVCLMDDLRIRTAGDNMCSLDVR